MAAKNEITCVNPTVRIAGEDKTDMECIRITKRVGINPSTCELRYSAGQDTTGPATLVNGGDYKHHQRVIVYESDFDRIWFHGWLSKRLDQHRSNCVIWKATDDTMLLRNVFVKGCFVNDNLVAGGRELKFAPAMNAIFNPKGAWNCTGVSIGGNVYPVFSPTAIYGKAYESPDQDYSGDPPTDGSHTPWTPRRVLKYLQLIMHSYEVNGGFVNGEDSDTACSVNSDYLSLTYGHVNTIDGIDPGISEVDPLDRSMQQLSLQGDTLIGAFTKVLNVAGTHQLATIYDTTSVTAGKTKLWFKPFGYVSVDAWTNIGVQFTGAVDKSLGTIYDFSLLEDSTNVVRATYCEGEPEYVETGLEYDPDDEESSTILPAWSDAEEDAFLSCVLGSVGRSSGDTSKKYAMIPKVQGKSAYSGGDFQVCDGTNGTTIVQAMTSEALSLAQQSFPMVFRAFVVNNIAALKDALGQYSLENPRPILPQQLQFYTYQASKIGDIRLRMSLPVRLRIRPSDDDEYYDVPRDTAIRVTTDDQGVNLIWLDGAGIAADGSIECIYKPSIVESYKHITSDMVKLRAFKLNCAMRTDDRVKGYATSSALANVSDDMHSAFSGNIPFRYLDRPGAFRHWKQVDSYPAKNIKYFGGTDGTTEVSMPLNRDVPPGDESDNAEYAAMRELQRIRRPSRDSSWMQAGIQRDLDSGDWLGYVYCWKNGTAINYLVDGAVNTVVWDFLNQTTKIGDVFGEGSQAEI